MARRARKKKRGAFVPTPREPTGGRPSSYLPEYVSVAKKMTEIGATVRDLAEAFSVTPATIWHWQNAHPEFLAAMKLGRDGPDDRVERSLFEKACGYSYDAVKIQVNKDGEVTSVPYVEHVPPSDVACIYWLKNRRPEKWREHREAAGGDAPGEEKITVTGGLTDLKKRAGE